LIAAVIVVNGGGIELAAVLNVQINGTVFTNNTAATGEPRLHVLASLHANRCTALSLIELEAQSRL